MHPQKRRRYVTEIDLKTTMRYKRKKENLIKTSKEKRARNYLKYNYAETISLD